MPDSGIAVSLLAGDRRASFCPRSRATDGGLASRPVILG
jgi:hypothetical protein